MLSYLSSFLKKNNNRTANFFHKKYTEMKMSNEKLLEIEQDEEQLLSPEYVRISMAAAIELGLKQGQLMRGCGCGCINLLQNYPEGCYANCSYCGLARERPGTAEDNSFIRVAWPLFKTDLVAQKIAEKEAKSEVGRVCISQVHDPRNNDDLLEMADVIHRAAPKVPISALINATTMTEEVLVKLKSVGVDIIGVGLDAASEEVFYDTRGKGAKGPHNWNGHWKIINRARELYGPLNINCHTVVGLGETDREMVELFSGLHKKQIACYLFSFNPEEGTAMQDVARQPIDRQRHIQLVKYLIEHMNVDKSAIQFDEYDAISKINVDQNILDTAIGRGAAFMTDGCPDRHGEMSCNRPYGSYRPGEEFRDYPFAPNKNDLRVIESQMRLNELAPSNGNVTN